MAETTAVMQLPVFLFSAERFHLLIFSKILRLSHLNCLYFFPSSSCKFTWINIHSNPSLFSEMGSLVLSVSCSPTFVLETIYSYSLCQSASLSLFLSPLSLLLCLCLCFWPALCRDVCVYASLSICVFLYSFVLGYAVLCMCVFCFFMAFYLFFCFFIFLCLFLS